MCSWSPIVITWFEHLYCKQYFLSGYTVAENVVPQVLPSDYRIRTIDVQIRRQSAFSLISFTNPAAQKYTVALSSIGIHTVIME